MDIFKVVGIAVITSVLAVTVRSVKPELGLQIGLAGGLVILGIGIAELGGVAEAMREIVARVGTEGDILTPVLKVTGVACMTRIASEICRDAGENALASKTELCGRLLLISAALPTFMELFLKITELVEAIA